MFEGSDRHDLYPINAAAPDGELPDIVIEGQDDFPPQPESADPGDQAASEADALGPPMAGDAGGNGPPNTTDTPPVASGDDEPDEPAMPADFGVERFREVIPGPEERPSPSVLSDGAAELLQTHERYQDRPLGGPPAVDLEREVPDGVEVLTVGGDRLVASFRHDNGARTYHQYYVDTEGTVRADDRDLRLILGNAPAPGTVSADAEAGILVDAIEQGNVDAEIAHSLGIVDRPVGAEELDRVLEIGRQGEPSTVSAFLLRDLFENRTMGTGAADVDSIDAAVTLAARVEELQREHGHAADEPVVIRVEEQETVLDDTGEERVRTDRALITVGQERIRGEHVHHITVELSEEMTRDEIAMAQPRVAERFPELQGATARTTFNYMTWKDRFVCVRSGMLIDESVEPDAEDNGVRFAGQPDVVQGDFAELDLLNRFLRKPRIHYTKNEL